MSKKMH